MINISRNQSNTFILNLQEDVSILNPYFIFDWVDSYNRHTVFSLTDESPVPNAYNQFTYVDGSDYRLYASGKLYVYESAVDTSVTTGLTLLRYEDYKFIITKPDDIVFDPSIQITDFVYDPCLGTGAINQDFVFDPVFVNGKLPVEDYVLTSGDNMTGTLTFSGAGTTWEDLVMPLTQTKIGANLKPDFDYNELAYLFPNNDTTEIVYFVVQMPHQRKVNSDVAPHVHYRQKTNQKPVFKLDYKWFNIGDSVPSTWKTFTMDASVVTWVDSSTHQIAHNNTLLDGSTYGISSMMLCKLYRDDAVVTGDVAVWQFDIHYEIDSIGSDNEYIK